MIFRKKSSRPATGPLPHHLPTPSGKGRRVGQATLFERVVERIRTLPGPRHLIEIGCGGGLLSLRLLQACPDLRITGLEASSDLVRLATSAAGDAGVGGRSKFVRSDLKTLPVSDHSADLLIGAGLLSEASSPEGLLAEIGRVLSKGGMAILLEPISESVAMDVSADALTLAATQRVVGGSLPEGSLKRLVAMAPIAAQATYTRIETQDPLTFLEIVLVPTPPPEVRQHRR